MASIGLGLKGAEIRPQFRLPILPRVNNYAYFLWGQTQYSSETTEITNSAANLLVEKISHSKNFRLTHCKFRRVEK